MYFHAVQPKGALTSAGLAMGNDEGVFAALLDCKRSDSSLLWVVTGGAVDNIQRLLKLFIFFDEDKFGHRFANWLQDGLLVEMGTLLFLDWGQVFVQLKVSATPMQESVEGFFVLFGYKDSLRGEELLDVFT